MHNSVTTCTKLHAHFTVPGCWDFCGVLQETIITTRTCLSLSCWRMVHLTRPILLEQYHKILREAPTRIHRILMEIPNRLDLILRELFRWILQTLMLSANCTWLFGFTNNSKIVSERETGFCFLYSRPHHGHNSLITPPLPNRLPRSQFLYDLDLVSCKIYLLPLTNALGTCGSPSLRRLFLVIDCTTNNTLIPPFLPPPDQIAPPEVNSCPIWTW